MKKYIFSVIFVFSYICILLIVGCSNEQSLFVGKWELENASDMGNLFGSSFVRNVEYFTDGTGSGDGMGLTWRIANNRYIVSIGGFEQVYEYEIYQASFTITMNDGTWARYKRVR